MECGTLLDMGGEGDSSDEVTEAVPWVLPSWGLLRSLGGPVTAPSHRNSV